MSSLPLLTTFLKSYSRPFLGLMPPPTSTKQISPVAELGTLSEDTAVDKSNGHIPVSINEEEELVEKEIRDRFKKMCEGYFDSVSKKLVNEHKVSYNVSVRKACIRPSSVFSVCKSRTVEIMKHISARAKYSRIGNKHTRR